MPIKTIKASSGGFREVGRIRKGAEKPQGNAPGKDLDHYRVTFQEGEDQIEAAFRKYYPDPVSRINCVLAFDDIDRHWDYWLEGYTAGMLVARSDGEVYHYLRDPESMEIWVKDGRLTAAGADSVHPPQHTSGAALPYDPDADLVYYQSGKTRKPVKLEPVGRLKVVVPELRRLVYLTLVTGSWIDIQHITEALAGIKETNRGKLAGVPLMLTRQQRQVSVPMADGQRRRVSKWFVQLEPMPRFVDAWSHQIESDATPELPSGVIEGEYVDEPVPEPRPALADPETPSGNGSGEPPDLADAWALMKEDPEQGYGLAVNILKDQHPDLNGIKILAAAKGDHSAAWKLLMKEAGVK